jgi:cytochrome c biogenesis protein CcmG/thiol:disulfide interchange protein DsbE
VTAAPGLFARFGLAIAKPRYALSIAGDRKHAGRSGSDLILLILLMLAATQLRTLAGAAWLGKAVDSMLGLRAATQILTRTLTVDLAFLVLGAFVLFATGGAKRNLGRAFDIACVAAIPLLVVEVVATTIMRALDLHPPMQVGWVLAAISWGWAGSLLALGWRASRGGIAPPALPDEARKPARITGWALAAVAVAGIVLQIIWIARHIDSMRPVSIGNDAPAFALRTIGPGGALGESRGVAPNKVTVIDFWATWCKPCIVALPKLQQMANEMPEIEVIAINLDDAAGARALFDKAGYTMTQLMDDGDVSERYNVTTIPHTVVIGRDGLVKRVFRGGTPQRTLEAAVEEIRK